MTTMIILEIANMAVVREEMVVGMEMVMVQVEKMDAACLARTTILVCIAKVRLWVPMAGYTLEVVWPGTIKSTTYPALEVTNRENTKENPVEQKMVMTLLLVDPGMEKMAKVWIMTRLDVTEEAGAQAMVAMASAVAMEILATAMTAPLVHLLKAEMMSAMIPLERAVAAANQSAILTVTEVALTAMVQLVEVVEAGVEGAMEDVLEKQDMMVRTGKLTAMVHNMGVAADVVAWLLTARTKRAT